MFFMLIRDLSETIKPGPRLSGPRRAYDRSVAEHILFGLGVEEVHDLALEGDVQRRAVDHVLALFVGQTDGGDADGANLYLKSDTGSISGTIRTEKVFYAKSSTGSVKVPDTAAGGRCEVQTSTGSIRLSISGK
jgi:hypothetical protein